MNIECIEITPDQVGELLEIEEGHFIDLKSVDVSPASLTNSVSAFANTSGGEIYVGIEERVGRKGAERLWRGFANIEAANGVLQAIEALSPLANHYEAEFLQAGGHEGLVLHLTLIKARDIIYASNGTAYIRRGAQKLPVTGDEAIQRLRYDKGLSTFEDDVIDMDPREVTNSSVIIEFLLDVIPTAEPQPWLEKQRLLQKGRPTVAGVLLFSEEPQAILPKRSGVKIYFETAAFWSKYRASMARMQLGKKGLVSERGDRRLTRACSCRRAYGNVIYHGCAAT